jgi:hypothetical protein
LMRRLTFTIEPGASKGYRWISNVARRRYFP